MLKSKNKIKRFSNKTKIEDKDRKRQVQARYESTCSGQGRTLEVTLQSRGKDNKDPTRLANFMSLDKKRNNTGELRSKGKKNSKHGVASAGNSHVDRPLKRTKSAEIEPKTLQTLDSIKRRETVSKIKLKKSPRSNINEP